MSIPDLYCYFIKKQQAVALSDWRHMLHLNEKRSVACGTKDNGSPAADADGDQR